MLNLKIDKDFKENIEREGYKRLIRYRFSTLLNIDVLIKDK